MNCFKVILIFFVSLSATKAHSSGDWLSVSEKQSYNKSKIIIGTKPYRGEGELVLNFRGRDILADSRFYKSRLAPGIIFEIIVDDGAWIKNANRPECDNSF
ncbi:MAG: hypothetical protein ACRDCX_00135 [Aeromonas sp.]